MEKRDYIKIRFYIGLIDINWNILSNEHAFCGVLNAYFFGFLILMPFLFSLTACSNPFKVTDPTDPRFDPDKFSFRDYNGRHETIDAFRKLFPPGTPKGFVDRVLVEAGGANPIQSKTFPQMWHYWVKLPLLSRGSNSSLQHQFIFDENMQYLLNIEAYSTVVPHPNQLTYNNLSK